MPIVLATQKIEMADHELEASLSYKAKLKASLIKLIRPYLKISMFKGATDIAHW